VKKKATEPKTKKLGATWHGFLADTDPLYTGGWNLLAGKNLNPPPSGKNDEVLRRKKTKALSYTERPDQTSLVFAPPKVAEYNSAIHHALEATTWGEFKALIAPKEYKELLKRLREGEYDLDDDEGHDSHKQRNLPEDNDPFDRDFWIPGSSDGDYPDWLQKDLDLWLPDSILKRFATYETSVLNGPFWNINPDFEKDIVEELRREGFNVTRRDDLTFY
jgi:hypothetical protein